MHRLHLLRHAKSDPADESDDHERPLSRRGREAARRLGESLPGMLGDIDLVLCSTALRTRQTAELALAAFDPQPRIVFDRILYLASEATLLRRLRRLDEGNAAVLVIGHNPGLYDLALSLVAVRSAGYRTLADSKFPTGVRASFAIDTAWAELGRSRYELTDYVTVKSLSGAG